MDGLEVVELEKQGLFGRLIGGKITENAYREIQNMVASGPIFQLFDADVKTILRNYGLDLDVARPRLSEIYRTVATHFARNGTLSDNDAAQLERLADLFSLPRQQASEINASVLSSTGTSGQGAAQRA